MRQAGWYIVQTQAGMELAMCQAIQRACEGVMAVDPHLPQNYEDLDIEGTPLLQECFVPMFVHRLKLKGEWVDLEKPLLPGYLITVTTDPVTLHHRLRTVRAFSRLLRMGETIVPLRDDERAWLEEATNPAKRTVPISIAYREGDKLVVTYGPLMGHEDMVKHVNRKKCLAQLELHVGVTRVTTTVGLAVMPKQDALAQASARQSAADELGSQAENPDLSSLVVQALQGETSNQFSWLTAQTTDEPSDPSL